MNVRQDRSPKLFLSTLLSALLVAFILDKEAIIY